MIYKTIFAIAITSVILGSISFSATVNAQDEIMDNLNDDLRDTQVKAIPSWVDNNFRWYGEGKISQSDLLNGIKHLMDHNLMHISDKAAKEVQELRSENTELKKYKSQMLKSGSKGAAVESLQKQLNEDSVSISSIQVPNQDGERVNVLVVGDKTTDVNALVQYVIRQSYLENNKDLQFYADKVRHFNDMKEAVRDHIDDMRNKRQMAVSSFENANAKTMNPDVLNRDVYNPDHFNMAADNLRELSNAGETNSKYWEDRFFDVYAPKTTDSTIDELSGIVVLCNTAMAQEVQYNESELDFLTELADAAESESTDGTARLTTSTEPVHTVHDIILDRAEKLQQKVESMQVGNDVCEAKLHYMEDKLQTASDMTQMMNMDLQNALQKQQQAYHLLSSIMKSQHDTLKSIIQNMRA